MTQPLSMWRDTPTKQAILDFVDKVTTVTGPGELIDVIATERGIEELVDAVQSGDRAKPLTILHRLVPEYGDGRADNLKTVAS